MNKNTVRYNGNFGIGLVSDSNNNTIYNNLFNNTKNFDISISTSKMNITKTKKTNIVGGPYIGGNFWDYPNGTGFSRTCTDSDNDGICDTSLTLDINNIDYLPLTPKPGTSLLHWRSKDEDS
jgi:hypothetical protein